jgi:hypothetical protein
LREYCHDGLKASGSSLGKNFFIEKILWQNICSIKNDLYICPSYSERSPFWRAGRVTFVLGRKGMYQAEAEPCNFLGFAGISRFLVVFALVGIDRITLLSVVLYSRSWASVSNSFSHL